jgi:hypothetical protein
LAALRETLFAHSSDFLIPDGHDYRPNREPTDTVDSLSELAIIDLERRHEELRREYDVRFKGR